MMVPTIHLNGTDGEDLFNQVYTAYEAVTAAMKAHQKAAPHGRDYYPQDTTPLGVTSSDNTSYVKARNEWHARQANLETVSEDLHDLALAIGHQYAELKGEFPRRPK